MKIVENIEKEKPATVTTEEIERILGLEDDAPEDPQGWKRKAFLEALIVTTDRELAQLRELIKMNRHAGDKANETRLIEEAKKTYLRRDWVQRELMKL